MPLVSAKPAVAPPDPLAVLRGRLEANRDRLEAAMATAKEAYLPGLSREYRATLADLERLPSVKVVSPLDELRARRENRVAAPKPAAPAKRQARKRGA